VATPPDALHNTLITNTASFDDGLGNAITKTVATVLQTHDLSPSDKLMPASARAGDVLTCTVRLRNSGVVSTSAILTDVIPAGTTLIPNSLWWSSGEGSVDSGAVSWQGEIIAQGMVVVRFQMQVNKDVLPGVSVKNVAFIQDQSGNVHQRSASTDVYPASYTRMLYLPIIIRHATHGPEH
jgi:uncharacterized repeat protein (TIGR01451 family)